MKLNIKKLLISLTIIMLGSFLISCIIFFAIGGMSSVVINAGKVRTIKVFPVQDITRISLNTVNTDINIIPAEDKNIQIDFYGNITASIIQKVPELLAYQEDGVLNISINYPNVAVLGFVNTEPLTLDIYIPQEFSREIIAETIAGSLKIKQFKLEDFEFKSLSGSLAADSVVAASMIIKSTSGKVELTDAEGSIDISNISGNVDLVLSSLVGDIDIKTISGVVTVTLPGKSGFNFELNSISGRIGNEFAAQIKFADGSKIEGTVGQGASKLTVNTTSGEIKVKKGE